MVSRHIAMMINACMRPTICYTYTIHDDHSAVINSTCVKWQKSKRIRQVSPDWWCAQQHSLCTTVKVVARDSLPCLLLYAAARFQKARVCFQHKTPEVSIGVSTRAHSSGLNAQSNWIGFVHIEGTFNLRKLILSCPDSDRGCSVRTRWYSIRHEATTHWACTLHMWHYTMHCVIHYISSPLSKSPLSQAESKLNWSGGWQSLEG